MTEKVKRKERRKVIVDKNRKKKQLNTLYILSFIHLQLRKWIKIRSHYQANTIFISCKSV